VTNQFTLQTRIAEWRRRTLPKQTSHSTARHISNEIVELQAGIDAHDLKNIKEEVADIGILLFNIADMNGFDFLAAVEEKFAVVQTRQWGLPNEHGVQHHIKVHQFCQHHNKTVVRSKDETYVECADCGERQ